MNKIVSCVLLSSVLSCVAIAENTLPVAPEGAAVYFIEPAASAVVAQSFTVKFGLKGMGVAPAGIEKENTGHHHILINTPLDSVDLSQPLPATDGVRHFGGGQTETELTLEPGEYTLQLLLGNYAHMPHDKPVVSEQITIVVE
ncbi:MAG: DUF4399 domain-containing protein [Granulosicoccaceae bacterium]